MKPPSVPLKRSPEGFSDSDSQPTTDRRRVGPAQTPTLPASIEVKTPISFTFKPPFTLQTPTSFTLSHSLWPTQPTIIHADSLTTPVDIQPNNPSLVQSPPTLSRTPTSTNPAMVVDPQLENDGLEGLPHTIPRDEGNMATDSSDVPSAALITTPSNILHTLQSDSSHSLTTPSATLSGGHTDGLSDPSVKIVSDNPVSSNNSPNQTDQLAQISNGSTILTAIRPGSNVPGLDPVVGWESVDIKVGTGMPVSEGNWFKFQTVFRITRGPVFECYSIHEVCHVLFHVHPIFICSTDFMLSQRLSSTSPRYTFHPL